MFTDKGVAMSQPEVPIDPNFLVGLANRIFLNGAIDLGNSMDDTHIVDINNFTADIAADCNYVMRAYFPTVSYTNMRVVLGRRFPIHRVECEKQCLLPTVVLNTALLGHTLYVLKSTWADTPGLLETEVRSLETGFGFIHENSSWISILSKSNDSDYVVMIQAEASYETPEDLQRITEAASKYFIKEG